MKPVVVLQLLLGDALHHVQQLPGHQAFELPEGLPLKDRADVPFAPGSAFAQDQGPDFPEQRGGLVPQLPLQFLLPLGIGDLRELPRRELQKLVHLVVDVGPVRCGGTLLPGQELRDVRLGDAGRPGQPLLLQSQLVEPPPDRQRDVHKRLLVVATWVINQFW